MRKIYQNGRLRRSNIAGFFFGFSGRFQAVVVVLSRMTARVNGLKLEDADLGIDRSGFEFLVSQELLDVADVRAAFEHVRRARVAQQVRPGAAADVGLLPHGGCQRRSVGFEPPTVARRSS